MVDRQFTEGSEVADFNEQVWGELRERGHVPTMLRPDALATPTGTTTRGTSAIVIMRAARRITIALLGQSDRYLSPWLLQREGLGNPLDPDLWKVCDLTARAAGLSQRRSNAQRSRPLRPGDLGQA